MTDRQSINPNELHALPGLTPAADETLKSLLAGAIAGEVPVYYAAVPLARIRPFDAGHRVEDHPVGRAAVDEVVKEWMEGTFTAVWVYERDAEYILSDDYIYLAAAQRGQPDYMPCWVLGKPTLSDVVDVQGPIAVAEVARLLGIKR